MAPQGVGELRRPANFRFSCPAREGLRTARQQVRCQRRQSLAGAAQRRFRWQAGPGLLARPAILPTQTARVIQSPDCIANEVAWPIRALKQRHLADRLPIGCRRVGVGVGPRVRTGACPKRRTSGGAQADQQHASEKPAAKHEHLLPIQAGPNWQACCARGKSTRSGPGFLGRTRYGAGAPAAARAAHRGYGRPACPAHGSERSHHGATRSGSLPTTRFVPVAAVLARTAQSLPFPPAQDGARVRPYQNHTTRLARGKRKGGVFPQPVGPIGAVHRDLVRQGGAVLCGRPGLPRGRWLRYWGRIQG